KQLVGQVLIFAFQSRIGTVRAFEIAPARQLDVQLRYARQESLEWLHETVIGNSQHGRSGCLIRRESQHGSDSKLVTNAICRSPKLHHQPYRRNKLRDTGCEG